MNKVALETNQRIAEQKDQKRNAEIARATLALEAQKTSPEVFDKEVKNEMQQALLRMAEHRVMAEIKCETLEKQLAEKDLEIKKLTDELQKYKN